MKKQLMKLSAMALAVAGAYSARRGLAMGALEMALTAEAHAKLPDAVKGAYVKKDDGSYQLDFTVEDTKGLKSALEKERQARAAEEKLRKEIERRFEGIDPEEVKRMLEQVEGDEDLKDIKAGKIENVVTRKTEKLRQAHEKALKSAQAEAEKERTRAKRFEQQVLDNHIRAAAGKAGLHTHAVDDALFRARSLFTLNEEGHPVQLKDGEVVLGKDGKTPFTPFEWLEGMKEGAPHWFPSSSSGGGAGGSGHKPGEKVIKRNAFDQLGAEDRAKHMKEGYKVVD